VTWTQQKPRSLVIGGFDSVHGAATIIDRMLEAGLHSVALSVLTSERTAERLRTLSARPEPSTGARAGAGLERVTANLSPLLPFGASSSGLVATGLLKAALITAGIGSGRGFEQTLVGLGIRSDAAAELARQVAQGGLLVGARIEELDPAAQSAAALLEQGATLAVHLQIAHSPTGTRVVARPAAPGNSRAP
jgi:hypothetical protein